MLVVTSASAADLPSAAETAQHLPLDLGDWPWAHCRLSPGRAECRAFLRDADVSLVIEDRVGEVRPGCRTDGSRTACVVVSRYDDSRALLAALLPIEASADWAGRLAAAGVLSATCDGQGTRAIRCGGRTERGLVRVEVDESYDIEGGPTVSVYGAAFASVPRISLLVSVSQDALAAPILEALSPLPPAWTRALPVPAAIEARLRSAGFALRGCNALEQPLFWGCFADRAGVVAEVQLQDWDPSSAVDFGGGWFSGQANAFAGVRTLKVTVKREDLASEIRDRLARASGPASHRGDAAIALLGPLGWRLTGRADGDGEDYDAMTLWRDGAWANLTFTGTESTVLVEVLDNRAARALRDELLR